MPKHLVFYDGKCGLCDRMVQFVLQQDRERIFAFAPLEGETADYWFAQMPSQEQREDTVVLIEDFVSSKPRIWTLARAAFRILWLLGGWWRWLGWGVFLPRWSIDWGYRLVARNRKRFFRQDICIVPDPQQKDRFFP